MYKLYTSLYRKSNRVVQLPEDAILHRCANVMEVIFSNNLVSYTDHVTTMFCSDLVCGRKEKNVIDQIICIDAQM